MRSLSIATFLSSSLNHHACVGEFGKNKKAVPYNIVKAPAIRYRYCQFFKSPPLRCANPKFISEPMIVQLKFSIKWYQQSDRSTKESLRHVAWLVRCDFRKNSPSSSRVPKALTPRLLGLCVITRDDHHECGRHDALRKAQKETLDPETSVRCDTSSRHRDRTPGNYYGANRAT